MMDRLDLAGRQRIRLMQQAADQGRLAVIDMADDDELEQVALLCRHRAAHM
jgi:hypothetical protein